MFKINSYWLYSCFSSHNTHPPPSILSALHPEHGQVVGGQEPVPVVGPDKLF